MSYLIQSNSKEIDFKAWDAFLVNHPKGSIFQSSDMFEFFRKTKNFEPVSILVSDNNQILGILLAVIIREYPGKIGFLSSRTVIYGGPVIQNQFKKPQVILDILLKELIKIVKNRSVFIQFRNFYDCAGFFDIFHQNGFKHLERLNYLVDTSSVVDVKQNISSSKLRQVKKGLKLGAEIIDPENIEQVKIFYEILHTLYKNKVKKPLPKWSFFENFYKMSKEGKLGVIKLIKYKNNIIGGILSPIFNDSTIYEWYVCGEDYKYKHLYPSVLATWAAIDYAVKNNITSFDFMGVGTPDKNYGVREFKAKFGGELVNFGRFGRINNKFLYAITEIGFNILALLKKI